MLMLTGLTLLFTFGDWLRPADRWLWDWQLRQFPRPDSGKVVVVAIDQLSLQKLGRWPWSRQTHAALVEHLHAAGARAIGLDLVFSEPASETGDQALAQALAASGQVVLPVMIEQSRPGGPLVETLPLPRLLQAAAALGHVDVEPDSDGVVRGGFLDAGLGTPHWSALALALWRLADAAPEPTGLRAPSGVAPSPFIWARDRWVLIPFVYPPGRLPQVSYADVLDGRYPADLFHDRYVLVGATAAGLGQRLLTPVAPQAGLYGVEYHAHLLDSLLGGHLVQPLDTAWRLPLIVLLTLSGLWLIGRLPPLLGALATTLLAVTVLAGSMALARLAGIWFSPTPMLLALALGWPLLVWRWLLVDRHRARSSLRAVGDGVISTDADGQVDYLNPAAELLTCQSLDQARGQPLESMLRWQCSGHGPVQTLLLDGERRLELPTEAVLLGPGETQRPVRATAAPIDGPDGHPLGWVVVLKDLSDTLHLTRQIAHQASHDALTQLPNRELLRDRLEHALAQTYRAERRLALLLLDLDRFKRVNDSLGHDTGDALLKAVTNRLKANCRESDTLARFGGDEFVIVLEHLAHNELAASVAKKILHALESPFRIDGREFVLSASIGISLYPQDGLDAETLLKNADSAMYRAKESGGNGVQFYAGEMNVQAVERLLLETGLRQALERGELELVYQPQLRLADNCIVGVEALLRWRHPQHGLLEPGRFIDLAEETGLIVAIGDWVLKTACQQVLNWRDQGYGSLRVAVNLSARQFRQNIVGIITHLLDQTGLPAELLELEITESLLMDDVQRVVTVLHDLKALGVLLAVDDFGTGYSSLSYLKRFPIDRLKIDRAFVRDITSSPNDAAIVSAVIAMAHSLEMQVIAEGVEHKGQADFIRSRQCDEIQGYWLSPPLPARQLSPLLAQSPVPLKNARIPLCNP